MYIFPRIIKKLRPSAVKKSKFDKDSKYESGCTIIGSSFGAHSYCGYECTILNASIGKYTSIADNVSIGLINHRMDLISTSPCFIAQKDSIKLKIFNGELEKTRLTTIGNDVWIGKGVFIKSGVIIGDGAIIGMGSVVTKNVAPYSIVAGSPAKFIKNRFDDETIKKLLEFKWWNLNEKILKENNGFDGNPQVFIEWYKKTFEKN